jgi:hypothetical protein
LFQDAHPPNFTPEIRVPSQTEFSTKFL